MPIPICRRLFEHAIRFALSLARAKAGSNIAAKIAMMAITTKSSIKVNARLRKIAPPAPVVLAKETVLFTLN